MKRILYLLSVHAVALALLSVVRLVFFFAVRSQLTPDVAGQPALVATAFVRGIWMDNVVACYIVALPLLFVVGAAVAGWWRAACYRVLNVWFGVMYALVFMAATANIPYFCYFTKPLNASIWNWAEYGTQTAGMIFGEASYWLYIALFFAVTAVFSFFLWWLRKRYLKADSAEPSAGRIAWKQRAVRGSVGVVILALCFLGIRGRMGYNPIKVSAAYFCSSPVLNNLGVNPTFALLYSTLDNLRPENRTLHLMDDAEALQNVQKTYGRRGIDGVSPIARRVEPTGQPTGENVVIVLMESMSAQLMGSFGNETFLTPNLDMLYRHSLSFANFYSSGNHTNHGIYATLYSFPSIMFRNAMKGTSVPVYSGLPTVLKANGYSTMFFMTHESQYDNMNAFLRTNGFDEIYAQENYPADSVVNHFGVPDSFLFSYALPVLRRHAASGRPFFATLLTISNHPPYVVPKEFQDPKLTPEQQIVRYADACIGRFMAEVQKEAWARRTIFVFLGDHGKLLGAADCELPESYNHIPLIIHADRLKAEVRTDFASQVDVAPTLLGLLNVPYVQNNLGIDLLNDAPRPAAFYSADKTIAARDRNHLFVYNNELRQPYFYALDAQGRPHATTSNAHFDSLRQYVFSLLQTTEQLVQRGLTTDGTGSKGRK